MVGENTDYDPAALITNNDGIRLLQNNESFELNTPLKISLGKPPELQAVPVKAPNSSLTEGAFEATPTLLAVYQ